MVEKLKWSDSDSNIYRQLAAVAVPDRAEQYATVLALIPFSQQDSFRVVELASGEGKLSQAVLSAFPHASILALDGEASMRNATSARLQPFGGRGQVAAFDMTRSDWYPMMDGADVVISSLCVHHLTGDEKQDLFAGVANGLSEQGVFLLADIILPQREEGRALFAATWNESAREQSFTQSGSSTGYDLFVSEKWNFYQHPDPMDRPSSLFDQLLWLKNAGFAVADCFWMRAGHSIYGGYKSRGIPHGKTPLSYSAALQAAQSTLAEE